MGVIPPDDPYADMQAPNLADHVVRATSKTTRGPTDGAETFLSGIYQGGIKITGGGPYTFAPGTYIVDGINVSGGSIYGDGVTIYNTGDGYRNIEFTGGTHVELSAPSNTGGDYDNILFFNARGVPDTNPYEAKIVGSTTSTFEGVLYFPDTHIDFGGNQDTTLDIFTQIIADSLRLHGTAQLNSDLGAGGSTRTSTTSRVLFIE